MSATAAGEEPSFEGEQHTQPAWTLPGHVTQKLKNEPSNSRSKAGCFLFFFRSFTQLLIAACVILLLFFFFKTASPPENPDDDFIDKTPPEKRR